MCASRCPDGFFHSRYVDSRSCGQARGTCASLEADSVGLPYYALLQQTPQNPPATDRSATHAISADGRAPKSETNDVYLLDSTGIRAELDTTFENCQTERGSTEDILLEPYHAYVSEDIEYDVPTFLQVGLLPVDTWHDRDLYTNSAYRLDDSATTNYPSTTASVCNTEPTYAVASSRRGRSQASRSSVGAYEPSSLSASPTTSELNTSGLHICHCNRSFRLFKDLERHIKSIHDLERLRCPEPGCQRVFSRRDKVLRHRRTHHNVSNPSGGNDVFARSPIALLQSSGQDIRSAHEQDSHELPGSFAREGSLSALGSVASSRGALSCALCDKTFVLQHDLLRHTRTLHQNQDNFVYRCAVPGCAKADKMFNRLDNFKKHLKTVHKHESFDEVVSRSKTRAGDTFTIMTPDMYSSSH